MNGGTISGNTASYQAGGVYAAGTFRIVTGTIYGNTESTTALRNTATDKGAALYKRSSITAQYGTFSGATWNGTDLPLTADGSNGYTNNTIRVVNGVLQEAPSITTAALPNGTVGTAYNQTLAASGTTPITWSLASGSLPAGLSLAGSGAITGTPTTAGTATFTVQATNTAGNNTKQFSITITDGGGDTQGTAAVEYYWVDKHGNLATTSGGEVTVAVGVPLTIIAQGTGYTVIQWYLNGHEEAGQTGLSYEFRSMAPGKHIIGLLVEKGGQYYNTNIAITVQ
jgi:hypothetical protein